MSQMPIQIMTLDQVEAVIGTLIRRELGLLTRETARASDVLTEKEAALYLKQAAVTLRRWRKDSRGPAYMKDQRGVRYSKRDLDAWLASNRTITAETPDAPHH